MSASKYTCGQVLPSGCILFSGDLPSFITEDDVTCIQTLDEILAGHAAQIEALLSSNDFTGLDKKCLDFDPATVTAKLLHQKEIDKICDINTRLTDLEAAFNALDIGDMILNFDLDCLTPAGAPCAQGTNMYSLITILTVFRNEICNIKSQL